MAPKIRARRRTTGESRFDPAVTPRPQPSRPSTCAIHAQLQHRTERSSHTDIPRSQAEEGPGKGKDADCSREETVRSPGRLHRRG